MKKTSRPMRVNKTAENVREYYNRHFFDKEGNPLKITGDVFIRIDGEELGVLYADLHPGKTIGTLMEEYHFMLKKFGDIDDGEETEKEEEQTERLELKKFKIIEYRSTNYLVEEREKGVFYIQRQDNQKMISIDSVQGRSILKKFREGIS